MDNSPAIIFKCLAFEALSLDQLYELMALRQAVFVVEQNCAYLDADGYDLHAFHLLGYDQNGALAAYTRLLAPGSHYLEHASIGRVAVQAAWRGTGLGRQLMQESLRRIDLLFDAPKIKISAQYYLLRFYGSLGFQAVGEQYLEDGIPHIAMVFQR